MTTAFVGSIPDYYDRHLGPVLFEPYAIELARRLPSGTQRVLEIAAGTGRVTRHLVAALPPDGEIVATDLNAAMVERARGRVTDPRITWQPCDAQALPFEAATFDVVVCQFGLMFVPDKPRALREMLRVLRPGGTALVSTWDTIATSPATLRVHELAVASFPDDPPLFYLTPFSFPDPVALADLALTAGFATAHVDTVAATATAVSAADFAVGLLRGNPFSSQLAERGVDVADFEARVTATLAAEYGAAPCVSPMSAHVLTARSPS